MKRPKRLTDWLLVGASDYAASNEQANRPPSHTAEEAAYMAGWRAAALDDVRARREAVAP